MGRTSGDPVTRSGTRHAYGATMVTISPACTDTLRLMRTCPSPGTSMTTSRVAKAWSTTLDSTPSRHSRSTARPHRGSRRSGRPLRRAIPRAGAGRAASGTTAGPAASRSRARRAPRHAAARPDTTPTPGSTRCSRSPRQDEARARRVTPRPPRPARWRPTGCRERLRRGETGADARAPAARGRPPTLPGRRRTSRAHAAFPARRAPRTRGRHLPCPGRGRRDLAALGPIVLPLDPSEGLERLHPAVRLQRPGDFVGSPVIACGHGRTQRRDVSRVAPDPGGGGPPGPERVEVEVETLSARAAVNGGGPGHRYRAGSSRQTRRRGRRFWRVWRMRLLACGPGRHGGVSVRARGLTEADRLSTLSLKLRRD